LAPPWRMFGGEPPLVLALSVVFLLAPTVLSSLSPRPPSFRFTFLLCSWSHAFFGELHPFFLLEVPQIIQLILSLEGFPFLLFFFSYFPMENFSTPPRIFFQVHQVPIFSLLRCFFFYRFIALSPTRRLEVRVLNRVMIPFPFLNSSRPVSCGP